MNMMCPMPSNEAWIKLKKVFKNNLTESYKVYMAHNGELRGVDNPSEIKREIGLTGRALSGRGEYLVKKKLREYNERLNQSHSVDFDMVSGSSIGGTLTVNYMPRIRNLKTDLVVKTIEELEDGVTIQTYDSIKDKVRKLSDTEWEAHGEIYPSEYDAMASFYDPEYQLSNNGLPASDPRLNEVMLDMLKPYGITMVDVNNFKERFNVDGVAAADMLNRIIYVARGKADMSTLPEEAAHFIIEMLGENHPLFKGMYSVITQTAEYKEVVSEYGAVYNNDEMRLRKEAMGKVLAKYFIKQYEAKNELPERVQSVFERVYNWFMNLFKKIDNSEFQSELDRVFGNVASKAIGGKIKLDENLLSASKSIYFELDKEKAAIKVNIAKLESRAAELARNLASDDSHAQVDEIKLAVGMLKDKVASNDIKNAIVRFLEYTYDNELVHFLHDINEYNDDIASGINPEVFGSERIVQMKAVLALHGEMIKEMENLVSTNPELKQLYLGYENELGIKIASAKELFDKITLSMKEIQRFADNMAEDRLRLIYSEIRDKNSTHTVDDIMKSTIGDVGTMANLFMPIFTSSDEINRMVAKIIVDVYNETHRKVVGHGQNLVKLQIAMEAAGHKDMSVFHERDANGNKTGYILSEYKWGEYNEALDKVFKDIEELFGEKYDRIDFDELSQSRDPEIIELFKKKKALWKKFNSDYSKYDYETLEFYPNPPKNKDFDNIVNRDKATIDYYEALIGVHHASKALLPKKQRSPRYEYLMPQVTMNVMQMARYSNSLMKDIGYKLKEKMTITEQDTEFGEQDGDVKLSGRSAIKTVPMYYTKPLEDKTKLTSDFTGAYTLYLEMATNFRGLTDRLPDVKIVMDAMANRTVYKTEADREAQEAGKATGLGKKGVETNAYKQLETFLDMHVYGMQQRSLKVKIPLTEKRVDITKASYGIINYIRKRNLIWNPFTIGSGFIKSSIDSAIEDVIGEFSTAESKLWAENEFRRSIPKMMSDLGHRNKTNKFSLMLEYNGIFGDIREKFKNIDLSSKFSRISEDQLIYGGYELAGLKVNGTLALSMYDNFRLVDGKFITKAEFKRASEDNTNEMWKSYRDKSLYNAYEAVDGSFKVKDEFKRFVTKDLENKVQRILKHRTAVVEGKLNRFDKASIFQTVAGQALMMHRPWIVSGVAERFKGKGVNYETGLIEEGYYRTAVTVLLRLFKRDVNIFKNGMAVFNSLDTMEKRNMMRLGADLAFLVMMIAVYNIAQGMADDDDEDAWWRQAMAFLATRALLEHAAFWNITEVANILNSPSATTSFVDVTGALLKSFGKNGEVEYGAYEGMTHREKALIQMSYLKNFYEMQHPELKNKYVKSQIL